MVDASEIVSGVTWSASRRVNTRHGERLVRTAEPTKAFWDAWREDASALKAGGVQVRRDEQTGRWELSLWSMPDEGETPQARALREEMEADRRAALAVPDVELDESGLLPFQVPAAKRLVAALRRRRAALDASGTGAGKTYIALSAARQLGQPVGVVCPKAVIPAWGRAFSHFGMRPAFVVNYELLRRGVRGLVAKIKEPDQVPTWIWQIPAATTVIWDEAHQCKGHPPTQNAWLLRSCFDHGAVCLLLSATLAVGPHEMWASGYVLGIWRRSFRAFCEAFGCVEGERGWEFRGGARAMARLHRLLFPERGNRLRHDDIEGFPANHKIIEALDFGDRGAIQRIYDQMQAALRRLEERVERGRAEDHPLVIMLRARQQVELLKLPLIAQMTRDLLAEGRSVAIFVNFDDSVTSLAEALGTRSLIRGGQNAAQRQAIIDGFNADPPTSRVIIANIQAGGVGISLHDVHGKYPRVALINPSWSAVALTQACGRCHRAGGGNVTTKILFAAGSVEAITMEVVRRKLDSLDRLNDGELTFAGSFEEVGNAEAVPELDLELAYG